MKFALNGALTIGTDDGANVEIRQLVGDDNFFLFGMTEPEVAALQAAGYQPSSYYESDPDLKTRDRPDRLRGVLRRRPARVRAGGLQPALPGPVHGPGRLPRLHRRPGRVEADYADATAWTRSAILNVARTGFFSSDRSMRDYLDRIWGAAPDR